MGKQIFLHLKHESGAENRKKMWARLPYKISVQISLSYHWDRLPQLFEGLRNHQGTSRRLRVGADSERLCLTQLVRSIRVSYHLQRALQQVYICTYI